MEPQKLKKLRQFYHSLLGLHRQFESERDKGHINIYHHAVVHLDNELKEMFKEFPNLLPPFNIQDYYSHKHDKDSFYKCAGICAYLNIALGRLKVAIDEPQSTPVTQTKDFNFISNPDLQKILERDFLEIQKAYIAECWKSVIILSGGSVEAILTDLLLSNSSQALSAKSAPTSKKDITKWDLSDLINVSVELKLISAGVEKLSHSLREYRNLVHPGREIKENLTFDAEEAKIAVEVLNILHRDLS